MWKRYSILFVIIMFIGLLISAGTYAYWTWTSNVNKNVSFSVVSGFEQYIIYDEGDSYFVGNFQPSVNYCDGLRNTISFKKTSNSVNFKASINMNVNAIENNIKNSNSVYWVVTSGDDTNCTGTLSDTLAYGKFTGKSNGSVINMLDNVNVTTNNQKFTVWIWIDSSGSNLSGLSGQTLDTNIWTQFDMLDSNSSEILLNGADPVLDDGMVPIVLSDMGVATVADTSQEWYNYGDKEWANAVLVKENATDGTTGSYSREYYLNNPGTPVLESDILAYYVWIPRYKYRITGKCSDLSNPTMETHSECYSLSMTDSEKNNVINWWQQFMTEGMGVEYALEQATTDVDTMLNTGSAYIEAVGASITLALFESIYNDMNDTPLTYSNSFNGNNIATGPSSIDISFEPRIAQVNNGDAVETYRTHPAFVFGGQTVGGIWVGKFESTGDATTPTIKPNLQSLRSQTVSTQFQTSLKFAGGTLTDGNVTFAGSDIYGLTVNSDSHMMKNSEWGAVAYLSHSKYGINQEIYINNSENFYTGRSGGDVGGKTDTSEYGTYSWTGQTMNSDGSFGAVTDSTLGTKASTTGNVTGVYDMSGGAFEYVMGVLSNSNGNPRSGYSSSFNSGFNGTVYDDGADNSYTSGIAFPNSKYYDLYLQSQFNGDNSTNLQLCTLETCGGHALNETANWYNDYAYFVGTERPWFVRGGYWGGDVNAGAFNANFSDGDDYYNTAWRSVVVRGNGA